LLGQSFSGQDVNYKKLYLDVIGYLDIVDQFFSTMYDLEISESTINRALPHSYKIINNKIYLKLRIIIDSMDDISIIYLIRSKLFNIDQKLVAIFRKSKYGYNLNILTELLSNYKLYYLNLNSYVEQILYCIFSIANYEFENGLNILYLLINHVMQNDSVMYERTFIVMLERSLYIMGVPYISLNQKELIEFEFVIRKRFPNIYITGLVVLA